MRVIEISLHNARVTDIPNTLKGLQKAVGGYIEAVTFKLGRFTMIVDEEGLLKEKPLNPIATNVAGMPIYGTAIICNTEGEDFCDVSDENIRSLGRYINVMHGIDIRRII